MANEYFETSEHRPLPHLLAGFSEEDHEKMRLNIRAAAALVVKMSVGADRLTDGDRERIKKAKSMIFNWKRLVTLIRECETEEAKEIIRIEISRVYNNDIIKRKRDYDG